MAGDANTPRKSSAKLLAQQLHALQLTAGILIKSTRSYKRAGYADGLKQIDVAAACGCTQNDMSRIENGAYLPPDPMLQNILDRCGFATAAPGGSALLHLLQFIRDQTAAVAEIQNEKP